MVRYGYQIIGEALMQWTRALDQRLPYKEKEPIPMQKTTENYQDVFLNQARKDRTMLTVFLMNGFQIGRAHV